MTAVMRHVLVIAILVGCGSPSSPKAPAPEARTVAPAAAPPVAAPKPEPLPPGVPDTVAGRHLAWVLDVLAHGGALDRATAEAHFDPSFLAQVPVDQLIATFAQLATQFGPIKLLGVE